MADRPRKLDALTGLRFVAAAGVVLCHSAWFGPPLRYVPRAVMVGQFVDLFFVLSGFILTYVYPRLETAGDRGRFLLARCARVWPVHALGLLLVLLFVHPATTPVPAFRPGGLAPLNLCMLHSWLPIHLVIFSYNGPSWSIATEFGFYFCFLLLIRRWERTWHVKLALACLLSLTLPTLLALAGMPPADASGTGLAADRVHFHPLGALFKFTLGMATAHLWHRLSPRLRLGRLAGTLAEVGAVAVVAAGLYLPVYMALVHHLAPWTGDFVGGWLAEFAVNHLPFALLIFVLASGWGWVSRLLGSRPAVLLGEVSYAVYILHALLIHYFAGHLAEFAEVPVWLAYGGYWLLLLGLSHFIWFVLERPARQWIVSLWPRQADPATPAPRRRLAFWGCAAGEGVALAAVLAAVVWYANRPPYRFLSPRGVAALAARGEPSTRNTAFGDRLILRAAVFRPITDGLRLKLVWESCRPQDADQCVAVHLLDRDGKILHGADYHRRLGRPALAAGALWEERIDLSDGLLAGVTRLGICVTPAETTGLLPVVGGPSDWFQRRLLVPLPPRP